MAIQIQVGLPKIMSKAQYFLCICVFFEFAWAVRALMIVWRSRSLRDRGAFKLGKALSGTVRTNEDCSQGFKRDRSWGTYAYHVPAMVANSIPGTALAPTPVQTPKPNPPSPAVKSVLLFVLLFFLPDLLESECPPRPSRSRRKLGAARHHAR